MTDGVSAREGRSGTGGPSLPARVVGILLEPGATYRAVADHPRWMGVLALTLGLSAAAFYVMMSSPELQDAIVAQQIRTIQGRGGAVTEQQLTTLQTVIGYLGPMYACAILVLGPVMTTLIAGILMTIFTTLMGGQGTFRQVLAIVAHSGVITTLSALFSAGMMAVGAEPTGVRPPGANLGVFVPMLDGTSFVAILLGTIDLFRVWWLISLAIGLGALYRRSAVPVFVIFASLYAAIAVLVAMVSAGA